MINIINANRNGKNSGIYSVCCAQPLVIEAAILQAQQDDSVVLIEATANQVNQFGGYTRMKPTDYIAFIKNIADQFSFPHEKIIFGGDHLGPVCWVSEPAEQAMKKAEDLISSFVAAGFKKIHLDASMNCCDDPTPLPDEVIAERAARLCQVAEETAISQFGQSDLVYIIGTEVPPPGGADEEIEVLEVTSVASVNQTVEVHKKAFIKRDLEAAWQRVIGLVVQPGVEFDHTSVIDYQSDKAQALRHSIFKFDNIAFEAHSTDYQKPQAYQYLVRDHFAILKVGPQLTYAMREALFALSYIEEIIILKEQQSYLRDVCEYQMQANPKYWKKFYQVPSEQELLYRRYSYSDRIRYYWNDERINQAVQRLLTNLSSVTIALPLISQFMPEQYQAIRNNEITLDPRELVLHKIMQVTRVYADACYKNTKN